MSSFDLVNLEPFCFRKLGNTRPDKGLDLIDRGWELRVARIPQYLILDKNKQTCLLCLPSYVWYFRRNTIKPRTQIRYVQKLMMLIIIFSEINV